MSYANVSVEKGVAELVLDHPPVNAFDSAGWAHLAEVVTGLGRSEDVRVIVITGGGDRAFSAGGDLSGGFVDAPLADHGDRRALADLFRALRRSGKPVVARVNGHALGGGFGLAAACDIVVAANTATLGTPAATEVDRSDSSCWDDRWAHTRLAQW